MSQRLAAASAAILCLVLATVTVGVPKVAASGRCGVERWAVKTGIDQGASNLDLGRRTSTTIEFLRAEPAPPQPPPYSRLAPVETTQWTVDATLVEDKAENDSDYHLVLADAAGRTMIAELPDPGCVAASSPLQEAIRRARAQFELRYLPTNSFSALNIPVRVTGIGFFDFHHGQAGVAPNAVELHPVTEILFYPSSPGVADTGGPSSTPAEPLRPSGTAPPRNRGPGWFTAGFAVLVVVGLYGARRWRRSGR
jgi:hypothetical protein